MSTRDRILGDLDTGPSTNGSQPHDEMASRPDPDLREFLAQPEPEYDWLMPDILERGDRVILTGPEGGGKSTFLRQIAVQGGAGIHPFTLDDMPPIRVLLLDFENGRRLVRRKLRPLEIVAGDRLADGMMRVRVRPGGIDLLSPIDEEWLEERIIADEPDLVCLGPLYKLAAGDPTEEKVARQVAHVLDRLRVARRCALIIEAHSPYAQSGSRRVTRPYGASLWSRWPEFGLNIGEHGELTHWRGDRDERAWPALLTRGGEWPWTVEPSANAVTFARILEELENAGQRLSIRDLVKRLGAYKSGIERAIKANQSQFDQACARLEGEDQ